MIGLAPSAAAAQVLADELGIPAENTAKWLTEHTRNSERHARMNDLDRDIDACSSPSTARALRLVGQRNQLAGDADRWRFHSGQLVLVDEASLAGTLTIDALTQHAAAAGAKVVIVGDWAQLGAIEAGGAFHLLATTRADTPELTTVRRFQHDWEADATTRLRRGDPAAIDAYLAHDRVHGGDRPDMLHALFDAWRRDTDRGLTSAMIALDEQSVADLNALAQAHRRDTGQAQPGTLPAADGHRIGVGDFIVTRRNDRRLRTTTGWVKNGDTWTVVAASVQGMVVRNPDGHEVDLPLAYVRDYVQLGYATTVHRGQGSTVDTAHALITGATTREALYVTTTRGRTANHLYVDTSVDPDPDTSHGEGGTTTAREALPSVQKRSASETSAHATQLVPRTTGALTADGRARQPDTPLTAVPVPGL